MLINICTICLKLRKNSFTFFSSSSSHSLHPDSVIVCKEKGRILLETLIYFFPRNSPSFEPYGEVLRHENLGKLISYYEELGDFKNWPYSSDNGLRTLKNTRHVCQMMDFLEPLNDFWLSTLAWSLCLPTWHTGPPWAVPYLFLVLLTPASMICPRDTELMPASPCTQQALPRLRAFPFLFVPHSLFQILLLLRLRLLKCCLH